MIVGCDPPNHALLVQFGRRPRPAALKLENWEAEYRPSQPSRVELAYDVETRALIAILFCRRSFFVPSFTSREDLLARWRFAHSSTEIRIDLAVVPATHDPVWIRPGVQLFLSLPQRTGRPRPFLHGLRIHTLAQPVELDLETLDVRVAPNSLVDAKADLFAQAE